MNYKTANDRLQGRNHASRKLENNTYLQRRDNGDIAVMLHSTDVVTYKPTGETILNSGGWRTHTTKDRINRYLPGEWYLSQEKGVWYLSCNGKRFVYDDGITIGKRNGITGSAGKSGEKRALKLTRSIHKYAEGFADALVNRKIDAPSGGDCWYCCGLPDHNSEHYLSHIEEGYYVPILLVNAVSEVPTAPIIKGALHELIWEKEDVGEWLTKIVKKDVKSLLIKFLKSKLNIAN